MSDELDSNPPEGTPPSPGPSPEDEAGWRLKSIIEGTNVGSWEWNVQTGETRFNERWAEIIGYTLEELGPTTIETWVEYANPEDLAGSNELLERHFAGELSHYDIECRMRHKDGHWVWVHDRGRVFSWTPDGKPEWMFGTHQDITQRKAAEEERVRLERQLLQGQKMESLGVLAGGIAHDFNNILGAIRGFTELTLFDLPTDSLQAKNLRSVIAGVDRASLLTSQMLAYSGRGNFIVGPVDLPSLVAETVNLLSVNLPDGVSLALDQGGEIPPLNGDRVQLHQMVMILVTNAIDAVEEQGGSVRLAYGVMDWEGGEPADGLRLLSEEFGDPAAGRYVFFEVKDDGTGMTPEVQGRFFEPFFSTKFQGRGLGMAAAQGIIRAHQGALMLQSEEGEGTTFRLLLPVLEASPDGEVTISVDLTDIAPAPLDLSGHRVLLVDDEAPVREMLSAMFDALGATVLLASDGSQALNLAAAPDVRVDLALVDVTMPGIDGLACLRGLREFLPGTPVLLMSGYAETDVSGRPMDVRPDGFLHKPFSMTELEDALRAVLER